MRELHLRHGPPRPLPAAPLTFLLAATLLHASAAAHAEDTRIAARGLRTLLNCSTTARWPLPKERAAGRFAFGCRIFGSEASPVESL
ncbi:hypothetical protein WL13_21415 [Burkholderia ubonensis]|uniref:hypothetical protein n=1 Tax=Burkholderia ubonensis TaxID=101571 RepID=UPI000757BE93|nr:hypothetical protein [Burkholderia ubonensis]KVZ36661.1 hypothetical protein WL13_21415 [Burkholderia ubonensis]KWE96791.1 hypothetical protein WL82_26500 [Burkholderia ubonensis]